MNDVCAVVVTYNRKKLLLQCLRHILDGSTIPDILVIDNFSDDGTAEALQPMIKSGEVAYYNTGANLGGAGGFNYGIRKAIELGYEYLWIMDDDCIPTLTTLERLLSASEALGEKFGFLSSKVMWTDGSICRMNVKRRTLTKNVEDFSQQLTPVVMASFVSLFIKASMVREEGLPIKEFFIWTDDWEYTRRISRGHPCYLVTDSVVVHHSKYNQKADVSSDAPDRLDRYKYLYRNDVVLYRREGIRGFSYECARLMAHSVRVLRKAKDHKGQRLKMIWTGTWAGMRFYPVIEYIED